MAKKISKRDAEKVLAAVKKAFPSEPGYGPELRMDFDWFGNGPNPSIVWEGGPYQWTYLFPYGGIDEEYGFKVPDVSSMIPEGYYTEAQTGWAISIYPI